MNNENATLFTQAGLKVLVVKIGTKCSDLKLCSLPKTNEALLENVK